MSDICQDEACPFARSMILCVARPTRLTAGRSAQRELVDALTSGKSGQWTVHVATFFTDVRPELVLQFAELHRIPRRGPASAYGEVKETGEANPALERLLEQLAP